jgi:GNAT superfamily N-acetyltransferase
LKRLPDGACEIKKMFVVEKARGRGVARALLAELEQRASAMGYSVARLDTGPRQPRAQRMYELAGYAPIGNFNANPVATFFGEKQL